MHSIEGALRMSDEINARFGFERVFGKTNGNADTDTKITKFGISFNSDGTTTFFAELEKSSASQKEYLEKLQEKKAEENKIGGRFNCIHIQINHLLCRCVPRKL